MTNTTATTLSTVHNGTRDALSTILGPWAEGPMARALQQELVTTFTADPSLWTLAHRAQDPQQVVRTWATSLLQARASAALLWPASPVDCQA